MDKLDLLQSRFGKIDEFSWWELETISADAGSQFTLTELKNNTKIAEFISRYQLPNIRR